MRGWLVRSPFKIFAWGESEGHNFKMGRRATGGTAIRAPTAGKVVRGVTLVWANKVVVLTRLHFGVKAYLKAGQKRWKKEHHVMLQSGGF